MNLRFVRVFYLLALVFSGSYCLASTEPDEAQKCRLEVERILGLSASAGPHAVLKLSDSAGSDQAKSAYRALAKILHSDKIGQSHPEFLKKANEAFDRLTKAYRDLEALDFDFENLLSGGYDRSKWSPLFPLKNDDSNRKNKNEFESAYNVHQSLGRIFVLRGSYPKTNKPETWFGESIPRNGKYFRNLIDEFAKKYLPIDSPFFGKPSGQQRKIIGPVFNQHAETFDGLFWGYIKAKKANTPFIQWSSQSGSVLERVDRDDRLGLAAWFGHVLDDVWISDWIPTLPIRAARVLMEANELQAVGARLAIYELARANSYKDFVLKGSHLPLELWKQAKEMGLETVRNFNFPVVGASLDCMNYLYGWTDEIQKKAISEIISKIESGNLE